MGLTGVLPDYWALAVAAANARDGNCNIWETLEEVRGAGKG